MRLVDISNKKTLGPPPPFTPKGVSFIPKRPLMLFWKFFHSMISMRLVDISNKKNFGSPSPFYPKKGSLLFLSVNNTTVIHDTIVIHHSTRSFTMRISYWVVICHSRVFLIMFNHFTYLFPRFLNYFSSFSAVSSSSFNVQIFFSQRSLWGKIFWLSKMNTF